MNFTPKFQPAAENRERIVSAFDPVRNYMATDLITFRPDDNISTVIEKMLKHQISGAPVLTENHELVGIISEKDCLRILLDHAYYNQPITQGRVSDYMSREVTTIPASRSIVDVADLFVKTTFRRFPVVEGTRVVGQISRRDVLRAIKDIETTTW